MEKRTFNYCCTFLGSDTLDENDIRQILNLDEDVQLTNEDWINAIREQIEERLDIGISIEDFNDIDIEYQREIL